MTDGPLRSLLNNGAPHVRSTVWIYPTHQKAGLDAWACALSADQVPKGTQSRVVRDLKHWVLFEESETRDFDFRTPGGERLHRRVNRSELLKRVLAQRLSVVNPSRQPVWVLMPSISSDERRRRYRDALLAAQPNILLLSEPEMVVEYFRLVAGSVRLKRGATSIFLVVDVGASTCNLTFVFTRRDAKVLESGGTARDRSRLASVRGDSSAHAGRWVDEQLALLLGLESDTSTLGLIEAAKVACSRSGADVPVEGHEDVRVSAGMLASTGARLWEELQPLYRQIADRLFAQLMDGAYSQQMTRDARVRHGVSSGETVHRMLDGLILAGGTSLLPGFAEALCGSLQLSPDKVFRVGPENYATAAAVGALAHVLHQNHAPPRLAVSDDNTDQMHMSGALPFSIEFAFKSDDGRSLERRILAIDRESDIAYAGGTQQLLDLNLHKSGESLRGRLLPQGVPKAVNQGLQPRPLRTTSTPVMLEVDWSPSLQEARLLSPNESVRGCQAVMLSVPGVISRIGTQGGAARATTRVPSGRVRWQSSSDVVVDLGMSKTVMLQCQWDGDFAPHEIFLGTVDGAVRQPEVPASPEQGPSRVELQPGRTVPVDPSAAPTGVLQSEVAAGPYEPLSSDRDGATKASAMAVVDSGVPLAGLDQQASEPPRSQRGHSGDPSAISRVVSAYERLVGETDAEDFAVLLLALHVRPFVLLAGPPGAGKSTLARVVASVLLGAQHAGGLREIHVQPHWRSDIQWYPKHLDENGRARGGGSRVFIFDECNLARPENYLMRFLRCLDSAAWENGTDLMWAIGTLNIDDASRPPSPKILDRSFLVEVSPSRNAISPPVPPWDVLCQLHEPSLLGAMPRGTASTESREPFDRVTEIILGKVDELGLREDMIPSRRARADVDAMLSLYQRAFHGTGPLSVESLLDRLLASRVLTLVAGPAEQVRPVVDALDSYFAESKPSYKRCRRRLRLAKKQLESFGFASPWQ